MMINVFVLASKILCPKKHEDVTVAFLGAVGKLITFIFGIK